MSINGLLNMRCSSYENPILDNPSAMDDFLNIHPEPEWTLVSENIKCFIQNFELSAGNRHMKDIGPENKNTYIGFFLARQVIGYRIVITKPSDAFPTLYIRSENPAINGRTGQINHYEYLMEMERS